MPGAAEVEWVIYTLNFKKVADKSVTLGAAGIVTVDLIDNWGKPLSNGLYYLKVTVDRTGPGGKTEKLHKIIVRR